MLQQGNVFGESFPTEVKNQIQLREYLYGQGFEPWLGNNVLQTAKRMEELQYLNTNTAWVKLVSSVNVKDDSRFKTTTLSNQQISENSLAKQYVLFGGIVGDGDVRGGLEIAGKATEGPNTFYNYPYIPEGDAYGIGGLETGFKPMPGIISATVEHLNNGTLRKAVIQIKAFNRAQFEAIDALYLRLGYSMLLEWGHTIIAKGTPNNVTYGRDPSIYSLEDLFLEASQTRTYEDYLDLVRERRLQSEGNYDGFIGRITNFTWEFAKDGSYDITLNAISQGDVIESLNLNTTTTVTTTSSIEQSSIYFESLNALAPYKQKHDLGYFLVSAAEYLQDTEQEDRSGYYGTIERGVASDMRAFTYFPGSERNFNTYACKFKTGGGDNSTIKMFVRFGYLLEFLEKNKLLANEKGGPIVKIDYDLKRNIVPLNHYSAPMDPSICIFNLTNYTIIDTIPTYKTVEEEVIVTDKEYFEPSIFDGTFWDTSLADEIAQGKAFEEVVKGQNGKFDTVRYYYKKDPRKVKRKRQVKVSETKERSTAAFYDTLDPGTGVEDAGFIDPDLAQKGIRAGRLMNVFFNMEYVLSAFDSAVDSESGRVSVYKFLQKLCDGFVESTGGYNKLTVFVDEDINTVKIIDKTSFENNRQVIQYFGGETDYATFNIYGFNPIVENRQIQYYKGTFIKNFSIRTELTKNTSAMIAISAAANNQNILGEDSTAFSKWNDGLEDRVMKYFNTAGKDPSDVQKVIDDANKKFGEFILTQADGKWLADGTFESDLEPVWNPTNASIYTNAAKTLMKYESNKTALEQGTQNPGTGFLPLKVSLTMKGLSGMKILQEFKVLTDFLPSNYPESLRFLVTNIKHNLTNNEWETVIETISAPESVVEQTPLDISRRQPQEIEQAAQNVQAKITNTSAGIPCGVITAGTLDKTFLTDMVVTYIEGGYWNKALGHPTSIKGKEDTKSGETMFGEDRVNGRPNPKSNLYPSYLRFWALVDKFRAGQRWKWLYQLKDRPADRAVLMAEARGRRVLVYDFMVKNYLLKQRSKSDQEIAKKVLQLIESDGRLLFHFWYATWNGDGWFQRWARRAIQEYKKGATSADALAKIMIEVRATSTNSLIADKGRTIRKLTGFGCSPR